MGFPFSFCSALEPKDDEIVHEVSLSTDNRKDPLQTHLQVLRELSW